MNVSIIMCVYNTPEVKLIESLESVISQTYKDFEFIIVEDGCGWETEMFIDIFAKRWHIERPNNKITLIKKGENKGLAAARNEGIRCSTGEWIYFIDSDDIMWSRCLEVMTDAVKNQGDVDIVIGDSIRGHSLDQANYQFEYNKTALFEPYLFDKYMALMEICKYEESIGGFVAKKEMQFNATWNKLYKRKLFSLVKFFEGHPHEDNYMTHEIFWNMECGLFVPQVTYFYRYGGNFADNNLYRDDEIINANRYRLTFLQNHLTNAHKDIWTVIPKRCSYWKQYGNKVINSEKEQMQIIIDCQTLTLAYTYWRVYCNTHESEYIRDAKAYLDSYTGKDIKFTYLKRVVNKLYKEEFGDGTSN